jgi:hypothetical protein
MDDHGLSHTRPNTAVQQDQEGESCREPLVGTGSDIKTRSRKRKRLPAATQLEWIDSQPLSGSPRTAKSPGLRPTKSLQGANPTICPKLLSSPSDQVLGQDLPIPRSMASSPSTLASAYADFDFADRVTSTMLEPSTLHIGKGWLLAPKQQPLSNLVYINTPTLSGRLDDHS